jgi:hypothetical protein
MAAIRKMQKHFIMENQEWGKERSFAPLVCVRERHKGEMLRADDAMSASESTSLLD